MYVLQVVVGHATKLAQQILADPALQVLLLYSCFTPALLLLHSCFTPALLPLYCSFTAALLLILADPALQKETANALWGVVRALLTLQGSGVPKAMIPPHLDGQTRAPTVLIRELAAASSLSGSKMGGADGGGGWSRSVGGGGGPVSKR